MKNYRKWLVTLIALAGSFVNLNVASGNTLKFVELGIAVGNSILVYLVKNDSGKPDALALDGTTA